VRRDFDGGHGVRIVDWLLERSFIYKTWQRPFAEGKLAPIVAQGDIARARRVLDVGCGPGTNVRHFKQADYLGIDINEDYVADATRQFGRRFVVADVTSFSVEDEGRFDFILVNSLLHHIDTKAVTALLAHLSELLSEDGYVHILDLVLPKAPYSVSRALARADRGDFPRPLEEWRRIFDDVLDVQHFEPYPLGVRGLTLWNMIYCKGRSKR
jgi:SAM-dependent methyltransferase